MAEQLHYTFMGFVSVNRVQGLSTAKARDWTRCTALGGSNALCSGYTADIRRVSLKTDPLYRDNRYSN